MFSELLKEIKSKSTDVDKEYLQDFISETSEQLESLEISLLALETDSSNKEHLDTVFRAFHTIKGLAGFVNLVVVEKLCHITESLLDQCRKNKIHVNSSLINKILRSSDYLRSICNDVSLSCQEYFVKDVSFHLQELSEYSDTANNHKEDIQKALHQQHSKKIGEILLDRNKITEDDLNELLELQKLEGHNMKLGQLAVKEKKATAKDIIDALNKQNRQTLTESYIRIPTYKVDNLVDMLGELIIVHSLIEQEASVKLDSNDHIITNISRMARITKEMQNLSMSMRMVSLKSTFQKVLRIARDTLDKLDKKVAIEINGEETEIDRGVAEKLLEPLVHLVKNALGHGIEDASERIACGKDETGCVTVSAYSSRGSVFIEVKDDGRGIDINKVYEKALQNNLINKEKQYSDAEIIEFILLPGFSTADKIDTVSGRGVGMDVVKTEVSKAGGKIEISSTLSKGTSIIMKIPINMAIMNGTIVMVSGSSYIIPTLNVRKILKVSEEDIVIARGRETLLKTREKLVPIISINDISGSGAKSRAFSLAVILEVGQKTFALPVDEIVDRREIVVKPLSEEFSDIRFVSGASILGDGRVSLILDIENLLKMEGVIG